MSATISTLGQLDRYDVKPVVSAGAVAIGTNVPLSSVPSGVSCAGASSSSPFDPLSSLGASTDRRRHDVGLGQIVAARNEPGSHRRGAPARGRHIFASSKASVE